MLRIGRGSKPEATAESLKNVPAPVGSTPSTVEAISSESVLAERPTADAAAAGRAGAVTEHDNLARAIKDGVVGGFIGNTTALTGEANFKGMLRVDGRFTGRVNSEKGTLIIGSGGQVDAEINVAVAKINGTINGNINTTERLELGRMARVVGNIQTPELIIEQGAVFEGHCRMTRRTVTTPVSMPPRPAPALEEVANGKPSAAFDAAALMAAATEKSNSPATPSGGHKVADRQGTNVTA